MRPDGLAGRGDRLEHEQLRADQVRVLDRRDDFADHPGELHQRSCLDGADLGGLMHLDGVDDADDGGVDRTILHARTPSAPSCR